MPIQIEEFHQAVCNSNESSPGEDTLPYEIFKQLPNSEKQKIVNYFNYLFLNNLFPDQWKITHIVPINKPNHPPHLPTSYRPISLTNTLCKILERILSNRLMQHLVNNNFIVPNQYGFQKNKSTLDPLVHFEYTLRMARIRGEYVVAVFLDIEKAYDMVWAYGLLRKLHNIGMRGHLPFFIKNFLSNRTLQVKLDTFLSQKYDLENVLLQGSIISVYLFLIAINKMFQNCFLTTNNLFCDDGLTWSKSAFLQTATNQVQNSINKIEE